MNRTSIPSNGGPGLPTSRGTSNSLSAKITVTNSEEARKYLVIKKILSTKEEAVSALDIAVMLNVLVEKNPGIDPKIANAITAIAFLAEEILTDNAINSIVTAAKHSITTLVEDAKKHLTENIQSNSEMLNSTALRNAELTLQLEQAAKSLSVMPTITATHTPPMPTYSSILASNLSTAQQPQNAEGIRRANRRIIQL